MTSPAVATLYISNLSDDLKIADLRRTLFMRFVAHGRVLDIVTKRRDGMRGQAHVVFEDVQDAANARKREDGQVILGKPMHVSFARSKSHATVLAEDGPERLYQLQMGLTDADVKGKKVTVSGAQLALEAAAKRDREAGDDDVEEEDEEDAEPSAKRRKQGAPDEDAEPAAKRRKQDAPDEDAMEEDSDDELPVGVTPLQPHHILACKDLPTAVSEEMLNVLFQQYPGFQRVLYNAAKHEAHVHYESWKEASDARESLDGFQLAPNVHLAVEFAPR